MRACGGTCGSGYKTTVEAEPEQMAVGYTRLQSGLSALPPTEGGSGFTCIPFCVEWVELMLQHTIDTALPTSEMEVNTEWGRTVAARCLKQVGEKLG